MTCLQVGEAPVTMFEEDVKPKWQDEWDIFAVFSCEGWDMKCQLCMGNSTYFHQLKSCSWNNINFMEWKSTNLVGLEYMICQLHEYMICQLHEYMICQLHEYMISQLHEYMISQLHAKCSNHWATGMWHLQTHGLGCWLWRIRYFCLFFVKVNRWNAKQWVTLPISKCWNVVLETIKIKNIAYPWWESNLPPPDYMLSALATALQECDTFHLFFFCKFRLIKACLQMGRLQLPEWQEEWDRWMEVDIIDKWQFLQRLQLTQHYLIADVCAFHQAAALVSSFKPQQNANQKHISWDHKPSITFLNFYFRNYYTADWLLIC